MLARTLGYKSAARMLADLTPEEYERWIDSYQQEPWGDAREDQRHAAGILWIRWKPSYEGEEPNLPELFWPYCKTQEQKVESEVETYKRLKQQGLDAQKRMKERKTSGDQHSKTSDPPNH